MTQRNKTVFKTIKGYLAMCAEVVSEKTFLTASDEVKLPRLVLATHNPGKVQEFRDLLAGAWGGKVVGADELQLIPPDETGGSFYANAALKAEAACTTSGCWSLADDSGLCVDALKGLPGVDTATYGGYMTLLAAMDGLESAQRTAQFVCVLALARPHEPTLLFEAVEQGDISETPRGEGGFGYDPVFIPQGHEQTYAELGQAFKAQHSHRAQAFHKLVLWLKSQNLA